MTAMYWLAAGHWIINVVTTIDGLRWVQYHTPVTAVHRAEFLSRAVLQRPLIITQEVFNVVAVR